MNIEKQQQTTAENHIIDLLSDLNIILLRTHICTWETVNFMSINPWEFQNKRVKDNEMIIALQFSNSVLRQFCEGITKVTYDRKELHKKEQVIKLYSQKIIDTSLFIRLECFKYLQHYSNPSHIGLWLYEIMNSLSHISEIMQSFSIRKN